MKIIYTDKLLEIARKSSPPSAKWFLSLPSRLLAPKDWGIYVVVLEKGSSRPPYSPCYPLGYATSKRSDIGREINWKQRGSEKGEGERRPRYVCSNIYMYTSYYSDTPRHKSSTVPLVTAQSVITRRYCGTSLLTGTSRSSLITAGCSADYTTTRRRIGTSCTGTKDRANIGAMLKKCFRILTSLQTGAAFSLLPSRLRYLEEGRHRKRNQLETEGERGEYTDKLLQIPNKSALPSANWFLSLPVRLLTPKARIQAPVSNGDRGSV